MKARCKAPYENHREDGIQPPQLPTFWLLESHLMFTHRVIIQTFFPIAPSSRKFAVNLDYYYNWNHREDRVVNEVMQLIRIDKELVSCHNFTQTQG